MAGVLHYLLAQRYWHCPLSMQRRVYETLSVQSFDCVSGCLLLSTPQQEISCCGGYCALSSNIPTVWMGCHTALSSKIVFITITSVYRPLFRATWVNRYQKGKTSLDLNGPLGMAVLSIVWTICKQFAPRSRRITTPTPRHLIFTGKMLFLMLNQQCQSSEGIISHFN